MLVENLIKYISCDTRLVLVDEDGKTIREYGRGALVLKDDLMIHRKVVEIGVSTDMFGVRLEIEVI